MKKDKTYIRDGRAPIPEKESTSKIMSSIKGKNTKPEVTLRKALWNSGTKGYRLHWKKIPGRPDIVFPNKKIAIFVNGCYWHRCPHCDLPLPKSNVEFWTNKFEKNIERDSRKITELTELGWKTLVIWECEIKNLDNCVQKIKLLINSVP
jgi:DNA mismatch endonuclease (patch repair protein)